LLWHHWSRLRYSCIENSRRANEPGAPVACIPEGLGLLPFLAHHSPIDPPKFFGNGPPAAILGRFGAGPADSGFGRPKKIFSTAAPRARLDTLLRENLKN